MFIHVNVARIAKLNPMGVIYQAGRVKRSMTAVLGKLMKNQLSMMA